MGAARHLMPQNADDDAEKTPSEMPQARKEIGRVINISNKDTKASKEMLRKHMAYDEIIRESRPRFRDEIGPSLEEAVINRHDQGHQMRTALNAATIMRELGFLPREIAQAVGGAMVHDFGYNRKDPQTEDDGGYLGGKKVQYKQHARYGAEEVSRKLKAMRRVVASLQEKGDDSPYAKTLMGAKLDIWKAILTYRDENGQEKMIEDSDIEAIATSILNHNDYAQSKKDYDAHDVPLPALIVQFCDKLDICRQRVYESHIQREAFVEGEEGYDNRYYHRSVPYCITDYSFEINPDTGSTKVIYNVDFSEWEKKCQEWGLSTDHHYTPETYAQDFMKAYEKSCRVAAEAAGIFLKSQQKTPLIVELRYGNGQVSSLPMSPPERAKLGVRKTVDSGAFTKGGEKVPFVKSEEPERMAS